MLAQEFRHARLLFTRNPVVAAACVAALAIGIAGNSAIFSILNSVILTPLPYPDASRLVMVFSQPRSNPNWRATVSAPDYFDWKTRSKQIEAWGLYFPREVSTIANGEPVTLKGVYVSNSLVAVTGAKPLLGTLPADNAEPDPSQVLISWLVWREYFHEDPNIVGKRIVVEGSPRKIRAVLPPGFNVGWEQSVAQIWIPTPVPKEMARGDHDLFCVARLRQGARFENADAEMHRIADALSKQYADEDGPFTVRLFRFQEYITSEVRAPLWILLVAVLIVQLVVCSNVAGLLLSRAAERAQETAIRIALGASLWDIARQCWAEGLSLALAGGAIGMLGGVFALRLVDLLGARLPITSPLVFNWRVAVFTFGLSLLTGLLASLAPWWQARFLKSGDLLKEGSRTTASRSRRRLLRAFAGVEVALSLVLLIGAGLLNHQLQRLDHIDPGFDTRNIYSIQLQAPRERYPKDEDLNSFYDKLLARAKASGLENPSLISLLAPHWGNNLYFFPDGKETPEAKTDTQATEFRSIGGEYYRLLGIRVLKGRLPANVDPGKGDAPMVLNETAAHLFWPAGNALGARAKLGDSHDPRWYWVAAVVSDIRNAGPYVAVRPEADLPFRVKNAHDMFLTVGSRLPQARVAKLLREAVISLDPAVSVSETSSMKQRFDSVLGNLRFQTLLLAVFSGFAMLMALVGVYSVMSYSVSQRTMEIGIRLALGADPWRTLRLILRDGMRLALIAALAGVAIAVGLAQLISKASLAAVRLEFSPVALAFVLILAASAIACFLPARRAALVDPMVALRPDVPTSLRKTLRMLQRLPQFLRFPLERRGRNSDFDSQWLADLTGTISQASSVSEVLRDALSRLRASAAADAAALFVRNDSGLLALAAGDGVDAQTAGQGLQSDAFAVRRLRGLGQPLAFGEADYAAWEQFAEAEGGENRLRRKREIATLRAVHAALLVPVWLKGQLLAILTLGRREDRAYDEEDYGLLQVAATQLSFVIENVRLLERVAAEERTRQELALAARVQRRLFPEQALNTVQIQLAGECQPARTIGGDYYDFLELPNGQIGIALADVAGKGIAAALLTSVIQASVRSLAPDQGRPLAELVKQINKLLYQSTESNSYATFFYAQFDPASSRLRFVNAGHNPPLFLRNGENGETQTESGGPHRDVGGLLTAEAVLTELAASGPIIGLLPVVAYEEQSLDLRTGDLLVAYTDGIVEALNENEEEYGEERLRSVVLEHAGKTADEIRAILLEDVRAFIGAAAQYDDMTALVLKMN